MNPHQNKLRNFPGVDKILNHSEIKVLIAEYNIELVSGSVKNVISQLKLKVLKEGSDVPGTDDIIEHVKKEISKIGKKSLVNVMNATGVIIHTNLGRAPFSKEIFIETTDILTGYNNLEFNLETGKRGSRYTHVTDLLKFLSGAEDVLVVNNNAAALMLILRTFAKNKEVIVSRGELIEIGGSFRLPEILAASDCKMVEVGTTNKTRTRDYENAINENTAILLKAHQSNYSIEGFTEEASLSNLIALGKEYNLPVIYDMGSGLLMKKTIPVFADEPVVKDTMKSGVDLVCFSGDKLLGGPQAGIITGKAEMIKKIKNEPMLRALRVDKIGLAFLEATCLSYLDENILKKKNRVFEMLHKTRNELKMNADLLCNKLKKFKIDAEVVENTARCGGGSMPGKEINSYAVWLKKTGVSTKERSVFAEKIYFGLLHSETPVLSILRKGNIYFDILTIPDDDIEKLAKIIFNVHEEVIA